MIQSSRRLERETQRNVELIWLTGRLMPDFKTIADFRKDAGQRAIWRFTTVEHDLTLHKYWSSACPRCPIKAQCTTGEYRRIARWLALQEKKLAPATYAKAVWTLETLVCPYIGARPIAKLGATDVLKVLKRIEGRGIHETAHRTRQRCSQVFRYAVQTERAAHDVTADLRGALAPVVSEHHASRDVLLAQLWLTNVLAFQEGFIAAIEAGDWLSAALHTPRWARENLQSACFLLLHHRDDFVRGEWPEALRQGVAEQARQVKSCVKRFARARLQARTHRSSDEQASCS